MKTSIEVTCPVCRSRVGIPCTGFILGGGEFHHARNARADGWDRSVETLKTRRKASSSGGRPLQIVEPLGDSSLVESFTVTVRCPNRGCKAAPGVRCNATRVDWHAQRVKRGAELKARYDKLHEY